MPSARRRKVPPLPTFEHLAWQELKEPTELATVRMKSVNVTCCQKLRFRPHYAA